MDEKQAGPSDWTEQDLLTRGLALERLAQAEAETAAALEKLRGTPEADPDAVEQLERRLRALNESRTRLVT